MDGRHLGRQNRVIFLLHLLGEGHPFGQGLPRNVDIIGIPFFDGRLEGTHPDADGPQIADLIDFDQGVNIPPVFQEFLGLFRGHRVQAAAEGGELHQLQAVVLGNHLRRLVQTAVVFPLVQDPVVFSGGGIGQMGNGVLGEDGHPQGGDDVVQSVVDFRVHVIGPSGQNDTLFAVLFQPGDGFFPFLLDILVEVVLFPVGMAQGDGDFFLGNTFTFKDLTEPFLQALVVIQGHKGIHEGDIIILEAVHVVLDGFRVGHDDGTVVPVVHRIKFLFFIGHAGIEDLAHSPVDEVLDVSVDHLGRITDRLRWDAAHTLFVDLPGRLG